MQQLLGDKAEAINNSVLRELSLQRLPANVRMVLTSTADQANLENLAQLADKVVEVATPSVVTVSATCFSGEFERLRAEVASLRKVVESLSLSTNKRGQARSRSRGRSPSPRLPIRSHIFAGITPNGDPPSLNLREFGDPRVDLGTPLSIGCTAIDPKDYKT